MDLARGGWVAAVEDPESLHVDAVTDGRPLPDQVPARVTLREEAAGVPRLVGGMAGVVVVIRTEPRFPLDLDEILRRLGRRAIGQARQRGAREGCARRAAGRRCANTIRPLL